MKRNRITGMAGIVLTAASVIFLVRRMAALDVDFRGLLTPVNAAMAAVMPFLTAAVIFLNACCWRMNLQLFSKNHVPAGDAFRAYARANIMKYLPGNVGHYAGRQLFGAGLGIQQAELAAASFLEISYNTVSMVLCALLFSARAVAGELRRRVSAGVLAWGSAGFCAVLACGIAAAYIFRGNKHVSVILGMLRSCAFWRAFSASVLLCSLGLSVLNMEYAVLLGQYAEMDFQQMLLLLAANYAAVFIGFITPGVPGGIGVREAVLVEILTPYFPGDAVMLAAVVHRIIMILGDLYTVPVSRVFAAEAFKKEE